MILTDVAIATINRLNARHPVRRVLQHTFHTLLIGNLENVQRPLRRGQELLGHALLPRRRGGRPRSPRGTCATSTSTTSTPDVQFDRRGTTETPFAYPYRDNVLELWAGEPRLRPDYLALYYPDDDAVRADAAIAGWADELDRLLPNPIARPEGGLTREWVARVCATVIHLSTVEHDILNNVVVGLLHVRVRRARPSCRPRASRWTSSGRST